MLIREITLRNIKSYAEATARFSEGTIAITGENGAGKSTLIEAIGFALFGSQRVKQEQLIRAEEPFGEIEINFISAHDESEYYITRQLRNRGASTARLYSVHSGAEEASGVREVQELLGRHLGLSLGVKPSSLFEGVVGVPQGQLTSDFLLPPAPRKARFEELLALHEYEIAFQKLSGPVQLARNKATGISGQLEILQTQLQEIGSLEKELEAIHSNLSLKCKALRAVESNLAVTKPQRLLMDQKYRDLLAAKEGLSSAHNSKEILAQRLGDAERRFLEAQRADEQARAAKAGHDQYVLLNGRVNNLEAAARERDELRDQLHVLEAASARAEATLKSLQDRLEEAEEASATLGHLQNLAQKQEDLEDKRNTLQQQLARRDDLLQRAEAIKKREAALREEQAKLGQRKEDFADAPQLLEQLRVEHQQHVTDLAEVEATLRRLHQEMGSQQEALRVLLSGGDQVCPACRRPFNAGDRDAFAQHLQSDIEETQLRAAELEKGRIDLQERVTACLDAIRIQTSRAEELTRIETNQNALVQALANVADELAFVSESLADCSVSSAEMIEVESQLRNLGDARSQLAVARSRSEPVTRLRREISELQEQLSQSDAQHKALQAQVQGFANLDSELSEARSAREAVRAEFDAYRLAAPLAGELHARTEKRDEIRSSYEEAERLLQEANERFVAISAEYDEKTHEDLRLRERELEISLAETHSQLENLRSLRRDRENRLAELRRLEERSRQLQRELTNLTGSMEIMRFLRDTIRKAGPEIARHMLARISHSASQIFTEMMDDFALELDWREDYGIVIRRGSYEREFQQLSGGEQMMAALAVRLALLRQLSNTSIAFFDEPTVNLDEERRVNLAAQIRKIQGFRQLFVISHDDSLEGVTDHVIRVYKENGSSRIIQG